MSVGSHEIVGGGASIMEQRCVYSIALAMENHDFS